MKVRKKIAPVLMLGALLVVAGLMVVPAMQASTCYGVLYEYYATSAMQEIVGAKVSCPGFPDQIDTAPDGSYTETAYYTTTTVVCPCPGGGGGSGGGETTEDDPE